MPKKKILDLSNARLDTQRAKMTEIIKAGVCPFCPKYLAKYHDHPIERVGKYWAITKNDYPYEGTNIHYVFIHRRHIEHAKDISPAAFAELASHIKWLAKKYRLPAGAFFMRFGDSDYTGGSVSHLHAQLTVGVSKKKSANAGEILVPLGYKKKK